MGTDNRSYAEAILKVCGFGFRAPVAFVAGIAGPRLSQRIEWILDRQFASTPTLSTRLLLGGVVAATLGVPLAAGALSIVRLTEPGVAAATNARPAISGVPSGSANTPPTPLQDAPQVYRPGEGITVPRIVKEVKPKYTPEAMEAKIQGSVRLEAVVLATGEVGDVEVIESLDKVYGLDEAAIQALKQWRFDPGTKDGKPVAVRVEVEMSFTLK